MRTKLAGTLLMIGSIGFVSAAPLLLAQRTPPPTATAAAAGDRKSVLFNWMWYTGMLRGVQEVDAVGTLELQATGAIQLQGQPCRLTNYRASIKIGRAHV